MVVCLSLYLFMITSLIRVSGDNAGPSILIIDLLPLALLLVLILGLTLLLVVLFSQKRPSSLDFWFYLRLHRAFCRQG